MLSQQLQKKAGVIRFQADLEKWAGCSIIDIGVYSGLGLITIHLDNELGAYKIAYQYRRVSTTVSRENGHYCVKIYDQPQTTSVPSRYSAQDAQIMEALIASSYPDKRHIQQAPDGEIAPANRRGVELTTQDLRARLVVYSGSIIWCFS